MAIHEPPLVGIKLTPPSPPFPAVGRPRLDDMVAPHAGGALTLVTGPPGSGKTALLAAWFAHAGDLRRSWLTLDKGDNDPVRFWSYVIAALQRLDPHVGARAAAELAPSGADRRLLTSLLEDANELPVPAALVLDDFHVIDDPAVLETVGWAVEHLPSSLHVLVASRTEPPFRLPRLRLTGRLHEVRESELRFRPDEASALLAGLASDVDPADVAILTAKTEGWAAGLKLAGLSLHDHPDRAGFVRRFAGSTGVVADLLVEEVLDRQSAEMRDFLLRTCVLDRFSAGLCDAVTGRRDSARVLHELEDANLFVVPLDDEHQWYRYHQLFADLLRRELRATDDPGIEQAVHATAGAWYEAQGHPSSAVRHHIAAGSKDRAWAVVVDYYAAYYLAGRHGTVKDWLGSFPHDYLASEPIRGVEAGIAALLAGDLDSAETWAETAQQALVHRADERAVPRLALLRGLTAWHRGDPVASQQALQTVRGSLGDQWWPILSELDVGLMLARIRLLAGDVQGAAAELEGLPPGRRGFDQALVLGLAAQVALAAGDLGQAEALVVRGLAAVADLDQLVGILLVDLRYVRGSLRLERGHLAGAMEDLEGALGQARRAGGRESIVSISAALARAQSAAGRSADARTTLRRAREVLGPRPASNPLSVRLTEAECRLHLAVGRLEAAAQSLEELPAGPGRARLEVRMHVAAGRRGMARRLLAGAAEAGASTRLELTDELLTAVALAGDDEQAALEHMVRAVKLAEAEGYVQVFLEEGPDVVPLLHRLAGTNPSPAVRRILEGAHEAPPPTWAGLEPLGVGRLVEPLSDREVDVLRYLPGTLPYREIARELYISPNTLKTHMKNLYRKLEVGSRSEAVVRARTLELL